MEAEKGRVCGGEELQWGIIPWSSPTKWPFHPGEFISVTWRSVVRRSPTTTYEVGDLCLSKGLFYSAAAGGSGLICSFVKMSKKQVQQID